LEAGDGRALGLAHSAPGFLADPRAPLSQVHFRVIETRKAKHDFGGTTVAFIPQLMTPLMSEGLAAQLGDSEGTGGAGTFESPLLSGLDNIASAYPQQQTPLQSLLNDLNPMQSPASMLLGPLGGIGQFLSQLISQFLGNGNGQSGEQYFNNASGGSNGDPHLSFNGSTWDNMGSQPDLLNSNSFHGGYQLSTQTTPPNAQGVAYNQSATVSTNFGNTQVSLDNAGNATIAQNGFSYPLQSGTTLDLGRGETVTRNQDGSLAITCANQHGGEITTTMRDNGQGVDVNTTAHNVDLGGALVNGAGTQSPGATTPLEALGRPHYQRYAGFV